MAIGDWIKRGLQAIGPKRRSAWELSRIGAPALKVVNNEPPSKPLHLAQSPRPADSALERERRCYRALLNLSREGQRRPDPYSFLDEAARQVQQALEIDYCGYWELLPNRSAFLLIAGAGFPPQSVGSETAEASSRSFAGYALQRGAKGSEPVTTVNLALETRFRGEPLLHNLGARGGLNALILSSQGAYGVFGVYSRIERIFTQTEIEFIQAVGDLAAAALERRDSEARSQLLERALDASQNGVLITDALDFTNPIIYLNQGFERITGYSAQEALGRNCSFLQGDDREQPEISQLRHSIAQGQDCEVTLRNYRKNGELFWNQLHISPIYDTQNNLTHFIGIQSDITAQKEAQNIIERQLKEVEKWRLRYELAGRVSGQILYEWNRREDQVLWGVNGSLMLGYFPTDLPKNLGDWLNLIHPEDREHFLQKKEECLVLHCQFHCQYRVRHHQGHYLWLEDSAELIFNEGGEIIGVLGMMTNINHHKRIETQLRESEERLNRIIQTISDGLVIVDDQGVVKFINPAAESLFGRRKEKLLDTHIGIPLVADGAAEVVLTPPGGKIVITQMRMTDILWENRPAFLLSLRNITEQSLAAQAQQESEEKYRRIVELTSEGIWILNQDQETVFVNSQLAKMLGYSAEEILRQGVQRFTLPSDQKIPPGQKVYDIKLRRRDGQELWALVSKSPFYDGFDQYCGELAMVTDITERKTMEQALWESEQRLEGILSSIQDVVWSAAAESLEILYLNAATEVVYGRPLEEFYDQPRLWLSLIHPEDQALMEQHLARLWERGQTEVEYRIICPDGSPRWLLRRMRAVRDDQGRPLRLDGIDSDITERKLAVELMTYNATHDHLTRLPNRYLFLDRLEHALQRRLPYQFAVLFLDLDGFKVINDSLGHASGDLLLQEIARRLQKCLRPADTLARLGGDEFTVLVENINSIQEAIAVAERIHQELTHPFDLNGQEIFTNTSIGIALSHTEYQHPQDIVRDADTAMYQAKARGKSCYAVFNPLMHQKAVVRLQRENDLRRALERREFRLFYQPIINLKTGWLSGAEALIRWQHPEEGLVSPQNFIAIAEETGLIVPIGAWILEEACRQGVALRRQFPHLPPLKISVNVSSRQIRDHALLDELDRLLGEYPLGPENLKLEITESTLMDNLEMATQILTELRRRGIQICLDDFGTGYSSLSYLHRFPIHTLKIDRSFVMSMEPNDENSEIIRTIITLAHTLGLDVIAEGIETELQLTQLRWLNCEQGQGYYFAHPLAPSQLTEFIQSHWGTKVNPFQDERQTQSLSEA
ncbi:MAG: EAL domain-containing protein [Cyanobacteriota bacterium]|nr:EAL domain-containing protein [Cyanobacteriota bacterium]